MKTSSIRQAFLDFFKSQDHAIISSSSLVPKDDPSLLFTNAGMVQFKSAFLGLQTDLKHNKATSAQKCLRAGGKHNDLDQVGYTARHHTFFEMLGNFSFGDYFKREAINYAWKFLTKVLNLPENKLWITVHHDDDETAAIWLNEVGVSPERFSRCGDEDNFWSMGETGPCGPCTEIFYDHGDHIPGGPPGHENSELDRYVEIWNLVFMQYNRDKKGVLHLLPKPSVDTGMGLERIAAVMQGVHNNYEIDIFKNLLQAIFIKTKNIDYNHSSLKVIADHIRSCAFLIADGILPSNEGRGYVLRRIIRRAVRHGNQIGLNPPFFYSLVSPLVKEMGDAYPELISKQELIEKTLKKEELQFEKTLASGMILLNKAIDQIDQLDGNILPGDVAFKLYDTYGFPLDLIIDILREKNLLVDEDVFNKCMDIQKQQSTASQMFNTDNLPASKLESNFVGYIQNKLDSNIMEIWLNGELVNNININNINNNIKLGIVLDTTPFYAESGGQVGDQGLLFGSDGVFVVEDTQKIGQAIIHYGKLKSGKLAINNYVTAEIDISRRQLIKMNHTATHILQAVLKQQLGDQVEQKGSLVDANRSRFDFSYDRPLTVLEKQNIELAINNIIRSNQKVETLELPLEQALESGAIGLFGEKYSDHVRVLSVGLISKELCGGTHVNYTGELGLFKITSESGIASGVRRIEWLLGQEALNWIQNQVNQLENQLADAQIKIKTQEKMLSELKKSIMIDLVDDLLKEVKNKNGINYLIKQLDDYDSSGLRFILEKLKSKLTSAVVLLFSIQNQQIYAISWVSEASQANKLCLQHSLPKALDLVHDLCGKGGGRGDTAQGGGPVPADIDARIKKIQSGVLSCD